MNIGERSEKTRRVAISAMMSALGVLVLYLGSVIEVLDISMAVIASLFVIFTVIEYGGAYPWAVYIVTGILSAVLLPQKLPAAMYILFFGFYPIIKEKLEKLKKRPLCWVLKMIVFNICLFILIFLANKLIYIDAEKYLVFEAIFVLLANFTFVIYDIALTRLISLYIFRLRKKFKLK
ncbi:MAG: hypothetical protein E7641_02980 [Ruminococcaceae bacterium]|nr:hypothetical protein [Oscillospiraceae bacterium]